MEDGGSPRIREVLPSSTCVPRSWVLRPRDAGYKGSQRQAGWEIEYSDTPKGKYC